MQLKRLWYQLDIPLPLSTSYYFHFAPKVCTFAQSCFSYQGSARLLIYYFRLFSTIFHIFCSHMLLLLLWLLKMPDCPFINVLSDHTKASKGFASDSLTQQVSVIETWLRLGLWRLIKIHLWHIKPSNDVQKMVDNCWKDELSFFIITKIFVEFISIAS